MKNGKLMLTIAAALVTVGSAFAPKGAKGATNHQLYTSPDDGVTCNAKTCFTAAVSAGHACDLDASVVLRTAIKTSGGVNFVCTRVWNGIRTAIK